jgi:hypothetical protein
MSGGVIVRMWEVRARPEGFLELLSWVCEVVLPAVEVNPLHIGSEVFTSTDHRLVVISKWRSNPEVFLDPPGHLVERPAKFWDFSPVDR